VKELAQIGQLDPAFILWMEHHCRFCSSLVDRIVPGKPDTIVARQLQQELGYTDDLLAISEVYRLWAIEGDDRVRRVLSFAAADPGVIIEEDIEVYRELKLRLLNGTHTLSCGLAFLAGFNTVKNAMDDVSFSSFVSDLMLKEIAPAIPYEMPLQEARDFGLRVLDRFRNPHLQHQWISITMQYSSKLKSRVIPVLIRHYERHDFPPAHIALGFAAYLLFMRADPPHPVNDDKAGYFAELWKKYPAPEVATLALRDKSLWGADLTQLHGFEGTVRLFLDDLIAKGPVATLAQLTSKAIL
jgi:tagaturonate reductase